ncbi:MAG: transglutaminase-like domain-containing protein [Candidatus Humimicrobiaceae bacterium]
MRNKKLFKALAPLIACIAIVVFINTGCCYALGEKIGEQLKYQSLNNTGTSYDEINNDKMLQSQTSEEILTQETGTSNINNTDTSKDEQSQENNQNNFDKTKDGIQISLDMDYKFNISGNISVIDFAVIIPKDYKGRQEIINSEYSIEPKRIFDDGTCTYAEFEINDPEQNFEINIMDEMILYQYGLDNALKSGNKDVDAKDLFNYRISEKYIEKDDKSIIEIANSFEGEDTYALVEAIYNYVMDNMEWVEYIPEDVGAKAALIDKQGDCTSYSDLFIALLRARGIPARISEGYTINAADLNMGHNWVEVYFNDNGWVPFDPTFDDNNGSTSLFNNLDNIYVYFSLKRNDLILSGFHYYAYNWYGDGKVDIVKNISVN